MGRSISDSHPQSTVGVTPHVWSIHGDLRLSLDLVLQRISVIRYTLLRALQDDAIGSSQIRMYSLSKHCRFPVHLAHCQE